MPELHSIVAELNTRSVTHPIGAIQELRVRLKSLKKPPCKTIFGSARPTKPWAFHRGGREELQYNIGIEAFRGREVFRYGVALSFQTSPSVHNIDELLPKAKRFNEFLKLYPGTFDDLRMWSIVHHERSSDYTPCPIPDELMTKGVFIFLGRHVPSNKVDYEGILKLFDRLLPLYEYVESADAALPLPAPSDGQFTFHPGHSAKVTATIANISQQAREIDLRHNELQEELYNRLVTEHGSENVADEHDSGVGTRIDIVVRHACEYWFFEIKTAATARACVREAIGQLLEYSYWPGVQQAAKLVVVGETPADEDANKYLRRLRETFQMPIEYQHITFQSTRTKETSVIVPNA